MLNVQVHDSNVIKRLNKYGLFVRLSKWKPLSEKNMVAQFSFEKLHLHKRQASWTDDQRQGLAIMHSTAFDKKQTQDINTNTSYQLWSTLMETCWFGFGLRATEPGQYTLWADHELLSISKYSTVNCFHRFLFHEKLSTLHASVIYRTKFTSDCFLYDFISPSDHCREVLSHFCSVSSVYSAKSWVIYLWLSWGFVLLHAIFTLFQHCFTFPH